MLIAEFVEHSGDAAEVAGIGLILGGLLFATARLALPATRAGRAASRLERYRHDIGRAILLGLEVLIAADIIRTVALTPSMQDLSALAAIVAIRTFLSWSLALELDGRWPWQRAAEPSPAHH